MTYNTICEHRQFLFQTKGAYVQAADSRHIGKGNAPAHNEERTNKYRLTYVLTLQQLPVTNWSVSVRYERYSVNLTFLPGEVSISMRGEGGLGRLR